MNAYEAKQEARRQRYEERAEKARRQAEMDFGASKETLEMIPMGQPILVGHHSERRHRRHLAQIDAQSRRGLDALKEAKHYERKAASVGKGGISGDDPEAIQKLHEKIEEAERERERMKKTNTICRKHWHFIERAIPDLIALGHSKSDAIGITNMIEHQRGVMVATSSSAAMPFPPWAISNLSANIRRMKERLKTLELLGQREDVEEKGDGYTYREDVEENRIMFSFPGKPNEEIRSILKGNGFKWSPSRGVWMRQITPNAIGAAHYVKKLLAALCVAFVAVTAQASPTDCMTDEECFEACIEEGYDADWCEASLAGEGED